MPTKTDDEKIPASVADSSTNNHHLETTGAVVNYRDSWRIFRIITEFVEGYQFLGQFKREVVVMGSARIPSNNKYYKVAEELGRLLAKNGFTTVTGGGPGIMEAANKGAYQAGGKSVGLNIQLPLEQRTNAYVKDAVAFYYFFTRKVMLTSPGNAFVFFPGGFGTLDEFFEVVDYIELGQMDKSPIVLVGKEFWEPLMNFLRIQSVASVHAVSAADMANWHIVDTAEEAFDLVKDVKDRPNICNGDPTNPLCIEGTDWKIFRIMAELVEGFEFITKIKNDVTVLGTKSLLPGSPYYQAAYEIGKILAQNGYTTITGGGPGIMEAANKGAFDSGGASIGVTMRLEGGKERINRYVTSSLGFYFPFVRKLIITSPSEAFIFFPGGFGTLHQLFELLTLQETKKIEPTPILLYGRAFWQPLLDYIHFTLRESYKTISQLDEGFVRIIERPEEMVPLLR